MIQENKELLLKDICARLPYNVICQVEFKENGKYKSEVMLLSGISQTKHILLQKMAQYIQMNINPISSLFQV